MVWGFQLWQAYHVIRSLILSETIDYHTIKIDEDHFAEKKRTSYARAQPFTQCLTRSENHFQIMDDIGKKEGWDHC